MRIIVCVKQIPDLAQVRMDLATRRPILKDVPYVLGNLDKNALETALRIKEKSAAAEIVALTLGCPVAEETVVESIARAADKSLVVVDDLLPNMSCQGTATVLAAAIKKVGNADLIILAEGSTDDNTGQMGPMLAQLLNLPLVSCVKIIEVSQKLKATRSLEAFFEVVEADLPAIVTVTGEINEPRIPSIIEVMDASAKPKESWNLEDLNLSESGVLIANPIKILSNTFPQQTRKGLILDHDPDKAVEVLVQGLVNEGVLEQ